MPLMSINIWKLSTFACGGLLAATVAWNHVPSAAAAADDAVPMADGCEDQSNMETALEHLRVARHALHDAAHNKGEHRREAMKSIEMAIRHVKAGCRFADDDRDRE
jgi:hypothetical protein